MPAIAAHSWPSATLTLIFILSSCSLASAKIARGTRTFTLGLGPAIPVSDAESSVHRELIANTGIGIGGEYLSYLRPHLAVGANLSYLAPSDRNSSTWLPGADSNSGIRSLSFLAIIKLLLSSRGTTHPFILAGIGIHKTHFRFDAAPESNLVWINTGTTERRTLYDASASGLAFSFRGGIDQSLGSRLFLGIEGGLVHIGNATYGPTDAGRALRLGDVKGNMDLLSISARVGWRFR